jgi:hypothetical protein
MFGVLTAVLLEGFCTEVEVTMMLEQPDPPVTVLEWAEEAATFHGHLPSIVTNNLFAALAINTTVNEREGEDSMIFRGTMFFAVVDAQDGLILAVCSLEKFADRAYLVLIGAATEHSEGDNVTLIIVIVKVATSDQVKGNVIFLAFGNDDLMEVVVSGLVFTSGICEDHGMEI